MIHNVRANAGLKRRLSSLVVAAALLAGCESLPISNSWAEQAALPVSAAACMREPDPYYVARVRALQVSEANARDVLAACSHVVDNPGRATAAQVANALYFSGAAARLLAQNMTTGQNSGAENDNPCFTGRQSQCLSQAETWFGRALALQDDFHLARLERARVYRLQAKDLNQPARRRDALNEIERLQRDLPDTDNAIHAGSHFLRALLYIDLHPDGPEQSDAAVTPALVAQASDNHEDAVPTLTWASTLRDLAIFTDSALAWSQLHREHPDRRAALDALAIHANALGCYLIPCSAAIPAEAWDGPALARDTVQRAIDYFGMAQSAVDAASTANYAHPGFVETYVHLGKAKMHMAGLLGPQQLANYGCAAGVGNEAMLNQAATDLQRALDRAGSDSEAHRALACARLGLGDAAGASTHAQWGISANNTAGYLMQARVQAAQQDWTNAVGNYQRAAEGIAGPAPHERRARSLILLERARVQLHTPPQETIDVDGLSAAAAVGAAVSDLEAATSADESNWLAHLELGKLYHRLGDGNGALQELAYFDRGAAANIADRGVRAQALLVLSRILSDQPLANASEAIRIADEAFAIDASWPYREQACLARLTFGRVEFSGAGPRAICATSEDAPPGEGSLLEGMYHLRRAWTLRLSDREREWEDAYRAFSQGLDAVRNVVVSPELRDRLHYGRGTAQYCIGFAELGNQEILGIGGGSAAARDYFTHYGIADCPAHRR
jgi:hypothetical protein